MNTQIEPQRLAAPETIRPRNNARGRFGLFDTAESLVPVAVAIWLAFLAAVVAIALVFE